MPKLFGQNVNATWLAYDSSAILFADLMMQAGLFNGFGSNPNPGYDSLGWPNFVNPATGPTTIPVALNGTIPAGDYTFYPTGAGSIRLSGNFVGCDNNGFLTVVFNGSGAPVTIRQAVARKLNPQISLSITASTQGNPLRFKFMLPGHGPGRLLNQAWIDTLKPPEGGQVGVLRFMDATGTNAQWVQGGGETSDPYSRIGDWTDPYRAKPGFSLARVKRMPEEYIVGIINEIKQYGGINVAPWVHEGVYMTRTGPNNYQQGFRDACQNGCSINGYTFGPLNPDVPIYHEYSNECWNFNFGQWQQHIAQHAREGAIINAWKAAHPGFNIGDTEYYAHRKSYSGRKFKEKFAGDDRQIIAVWVSQGGYPALGAIDLQHYELPNLYDGQTFTPDAIGAGYYFQPETAPFVKLNYRTLSQGYAANPSGTLDSFFACVDQNFADYGPLLGQYMGFAASRHVPYVTYEYGSDPNSAAVSLATYPNLVNFLTAAYNDPRMGEVYDRMHDLFPDGSVNCVYRDTGWAGNYYWGIDRITGESPMSTRRLSFNRAVAGYQPPVDPVPVATYRRSIRHLRAFRKLRAIR
ncbi:hypothetical protein P12x_003056 [Tundrisphaera lichenicola]|uniref:hypothetical protein n=1 Tax=Tundrisphaera lichenicola TaxID=2029860 RepID=UPI003EBE4037